MVIWDAMKGARILFYDPDPKAQRAAERALLATGSEVDVAGDEGVLLERLEWGPFYGRMVELRRGDTVLATGPVETWKAFGPLHDAKREELRAIRSIERGEIAARNAESYGPRAYAVPEWIVPINQVPAAPPVAHNTALVLKTYNISSSTPRP